jgi:hypothetical protein
MGDLELVKEYVNQIEDIFCQIRDHAKTPPEISGIADFGQGRVANLKVILAGLKTRLSAGSLR